MKAWVLFAFVSGMAGLLYGEPVEPKGAEPPPVLQQLDRYIEAQTAAGAIAKTNANWRLHLPVFPELRYRSACRYLASIVTSTGTVSVLLRHDAAPRHVANFLYLVRLGFYQDQPVQFVKPGKRIQWGCPIGDGRGTPGYTLAGEYSAGFKHDRVGVLSTANAGKDSDGCQFFFTLAPMPWLDGKNTVFGEVIDGLSVLETIATTGTPLGRPLTRVTILQVAILEEVRHD